MGGGATIIVFFYINFFFPFCNSRFHFGSLAFQGVYKIFVRFLR